MNKRIITAISVFSLTVILACLFQAVPQYSKLKEYNEVIAENNYSQSKKDANSTENPTIEPTVLTESTPDEAQEPIVDYRTIEDRKSVV